ncbi:MAG: HlyD family type I secretion periplasmic adaptor subunit [Magnetococcales bacterium]|nr:HlyD family type I secretion periplasmic adaptor subunit [Magnetococcales bacterium]
MRLKHRWEAWRELWRRYRDHFSHAWAQRHGLSLPELQPHESEFLPAALAVQTAPVSPTGRLVARLLMGLIGVALVWSVLGQNDIIVNGQGKIIAGGYTKTITAVEVASVRGLFVQEGQTVHAGDLLIELDPRMTESERVKAEGDRQTAQLQAIRSRAMLDALGSGRTPVLPPMDGISEQRWQDAKAHLLDQWRDYRAKKERLDVEIRGLRESLPLARQREVDYEHLARTRDVSQHAWLEKKQTRMDLERQLDITRHQLEALTAETRRMAQDALNEANRNAAAFEQDARKASAHGDLLKLHAPVEGTVQQLAVHTVGSAVPAAQPLMQIVPKQTEVEMEAFIENKDVGFVLEGQPAQVKLEAFEYTKYGTIRGKVSHVSRDAIQDEKRGLIYAVKVLLSESSILVDDRRIPLSPGMAGSVEIKTGERRVIEYVLSPLIKHARESLHER